MENCLLKEKATGQDDAMAPENNPTSPLRWRRTIGLCCALALTLASLALTGCPSKTKQAYLRCQQPKGSPCMGQQWFTGTPPKTMATPWTSRPHFWRYRHQGRTVGVLLLGHPKDQMLNALGHTMYASLHETSSPNGFLATGAMYATYAEGLYTKPRERALLANWDDIMWYLKKAKRVVTKDTSAVKAHNIISALRSQISEFHLASQMRKVIYFYRKPEHGPLVIPHFSITSRPDPYKLRLSQRALPLNRATILGQLFFRLRLRTTMPMLTTLWKDHYAHNKKLEELFYPGRMRCQYKWYNLFEAHKTISSEYIRIFYERPMANGKRLRFYCNDKRLEEFRRRPQVIRRLRTYRREVHRLNRAFQLFSYYHTIARKWVKENKSLNASVAIDGILRQHTLYYPEKVQIDGKLIDPATLFDSWQKQFYQDAWRNIHKYAIDSGQYLKTTKGQPSGIFGKHYTVFKSTILGDEYQIAPYAIVQGSFAVVLDRRRGTIEVITNHRPYPFVGRRTLQQTSGKRPGYRSLRQRIEQTSHGRLTLVHASTVKDIPMPTPQLPPRSFLIQEGFVWLRLESTLTAIPISGGNALKAPAQRSLIQQIEAAMSQRDAIPESVKVLTLSGDIPNITVTFPGDNEPPMTVIKRPQKAAAKPAPPAKR